MSEASSAPSVRYPCLHTSQTQIFAVVSCFTIGTSSNDNFKLFIALIIQDDGYRDETHALSTDCTVSYCRSTDSNSRSTRVIE
jgi:hypothetical protein